MGDHDELMSDLREVEGESNAYAQFSLNMVVMFRHWMKESGCCDECIEKTHHLAEGIQQQWVQS